MEKQIQHSKLVLRFQAGATEVGQAKYKDVSFPRILESASDEAVKTAALALASMYDGTLATVLRIDHVELGK